MNPENSLLGYLGIRGGKIGLHCRLEAAEHLLEDAEPLKDRRIGLEQDLLLCEDSIQGKALLVQNDLCFLDEALAGALARWNGENLLCKKDRIGELVGVFGSREIFVIGSNIEFLIVTNSRRVLSKVSAEAIHFGEVLVEGRRRLCDRVEQCFVKLF